VLGQKLPVQLTLHALEVHVGEPETLVCAVLPHFTAQAPQLLASVRLSDSQPLAALLSHVW